MSWVQDRNCFQHDWLKNQYLLSIGHFANILADLVEDVTFQDYFFSAILPQWLVHREEALRLAETFDQEMSPRRFFSEEPLCSVPELRDPKVIELIHCLWAGRIQPHAMVDQVRKAIAETDQKYGELCALGQCVDDNNPRNKIEAAVTAFRKACLDLSSAIAQFPVTTALL